MKNIIHNIDFHNLGVQKYWAPPASWTPERKQTEIRTAIFSGDYIGSRKKDGAFYKFIKDEDGNMELIGRSKSVSGDYLNKIGHVPQLHDFFERLPKGTCLIGELYIPKHEGSNHVTTIMGCLEPKAIQRQKDGTPLHYYIFDVLAFNNEVLYTQDIETRIKYLPKIETEYICQSSSPVHVAMYYEGEALWLYLQDILAKGGEGIVITRKGTCYQPGKRPARQTFKVKKELRENIDVVIMGANPPTRLYNGTQIETWQYWEDLKTGEKLQGSLYQEYFNGTMPIEPVTKNYWNNWAGSLIIGIRKDNKVISIGSLSGLTEEVLANANQYKGRIAEITGMQVMDTVNQGIRHPKFVQWRPDLTIEDTDWYRVFGGRSE